MRNYPGKRKFPFSCNEGIAGATLVVGVEEYIGGRETELGDVSSAVTGTFISFINDPVLNGFDFELEIRLLSGLGAIK